MKRSDYSFFFDDYDQLEFKDFIIRQVDEIIPLYWYKKSQKPYSFRFDFKKNTKLWGIFLIVEGST